MAHSDQIRHMLRDDDVTPEEQRQILELALRFCEDRFYRKPFAGPQAVAVMTDKPTLRTQVSFTTGIAELGGYPIMVDGNLAQVGKRESIADVTRVLTRMASAIVWRTFGQERIEEMARYATVPVINALTDSFHPCQALADLLTLAQHRGGVDALPGCTWSYVGDGGNNMAHSYLLAGATAGLNVRIGAPKPYWPDPQIVADAEAIAARTGSTLTVSEDVDEAVRGADVVATDTWVSMGEEAEYEERSKPFVPYRVTDELMALAKPDALFEHCLPAYRGREVTASVIDGPQSAVWQEAENRLHAQKALLTWLIGKQRFGSSLLE